MWIPLVPQRFDLKTESSFRPYVSLPSGLHASIGSGADAVGIVGGAAAGIAPSSSAVARHYVEESPDGRLKMGSFLSHF